MISSCILLECMNGMYVLMEYNFVNKSRNNGVNKLFTFSHSRLNTYVNHSTLCRTKQSIMNVIKVTVQLFSVK